jgi:hypothetical protein
LVDALKYVKAHRHQVEHNKPFHNCLGSQSE